MLKRLAHPRDSVTRLYRRLGRGVDMLFDRRYGVDTAGVIAYPEHDGEQSYPYEGVRWLVIARLLAKLKIRREDVILDAGCGKGRVLLRAALSTPARKVVGFDISPELIEIARSNFAAVEDRVRCDSVVLEVGDATAYTIDDEVNLIVASNPFSGAIFDAFVAEIIASVERRPRQVRFLYLWSLSRERVERTGRFRLVWRQGTSFLGPEACLFEIGPGRG